MVGEIYVTGTLIPDGDFPIARVADVEGAQSATDVSTAIGTALSSYSTTTEVGEAIAGAIGAIPDATTETDGLMTTAQVSALAAAQTAQQVFDAVAGGVSTAAADATSKANAVRLGAPRVYATKAALRADTSGYSLNTRVMFEGDDDLFIWDGSSTYTDPGGERSNVVQVGAIAGRFVREGYSELAEIPADGVDHVLWSYAIPAASAVEGSVDLACSTSAHVITGPLLFSAHRVGSGSAILDSTTKGAPWANERPDTLPRVELSGNTVQAVLTADTIYPIKARLMARASIVPFGATAPDFKSVYRAQMIATGKYKQLYFADSGVTTVDGLVSQVTDASGNGATLTSIEGNRATLANETFDYFQIRKAIGVLMSPAGSGQALGNRTIRWTSRKSGSEWGISFLRNQENFYENAAGWMANGTHTYAVTQGVTRDLGVTATGWHNFELRVDVTGETGETGPTCYYLVDGVLVDAWSINATPTPEGPLRYGYDGSSTYGCDIDLAAFALQDGVGTTEETELWIAMAEASGWTS